jgi:hypothetical protein
MKEPAPRVRRRLRLSRFAAQRSRPPQNQRRPMPLRSAWRQHLLSAKFFLLPKIQKRENHSLFLKKFMRKTVRA